MRTPRRGLILLGLAYVLHQDAWNWTTARPLLAGFLPPGLWYHALYTLALVALFAWLVSTAWKNESDDQP
jgi:hypothetical protein